MKNYLKIFIASFGIILITTFSWCNKTPQYPSQPQIDFKQISVKDSVDQLGNKMKIFSIYFDVLDGDGDFGITENDTLASFYGDTTYQNNFFATLYYKDKNGNPQPYPVALDLNGAIPYTPPVGVNNYYKATVIYDLLIPKISKTLKISFYVIDRHLHRSNTQQTPWIEPDFRGTLVDTVQAIKY
jgi:hypothetical protein